MGKFKFKLSYMMPRSWFHKLKDMSKTKNHPTKKKLSKLQKSKLYEQNQAYFYYTIETNYKEKHYNSPKNPKIPNTQFLESSRNSSKKARRKAIYRPSPRHSSTTSYSASIDCQQIHAKNRSNSSAESSNELDLVKSSSSEFESDTLEGLNGLDYSWSSSCNCRLVSSTAEQLKGNFEKFGNFCESSELNLPPIQTRLPNSYATKEFSTFKYSSSEMKDIIKIMNLENMEYDSLSRWLGGEMIDTRDSSKSRVKECGGSSPVKIKKQKSATPSLPRKSTGMKIGTKSPKLASKKLQNKTRKSIPLNKISSRIQNKTFSESFAVVKSSINPKKDFRDSMMEMIVENNITTSKELEDLLVCFLSLNSDEYHGVIIKAFEQIWFTMRVFG